MGKLPGAACLPLSGVFNAAPGLPIPMNEQEEMRRAEAPYLDPPDEPEEEDCSACEGTGIAPGDDEEECDTCNGRGVVLVDGDEEHDDRFDDDGGNYYGPED